jgi:transposase-like protein
VKKSRFTEAQIVAILKELDAGTAATELARRHGLHANTIRQWRDKYAGWEASNQTPPAPRNDRADAFSHGAADLAAPPHVVVPADGRRVRCARPDARALSDKSERVGGRGLTFDWACTSARKAERKRILPPLAPFRVDFLRECLALGGRLLIRKSRRHPLLRGSRLYPGAAKRRSEFGDRR